MTDEFAKKIPGYNEICKRSIKGKGQIREATQLEAISSPKPEKMGSSAGGLKLRVSNILFSRDKILDVSSALAHHFLPSTVHLHEEDGAKLHLSSGDDVVLLANGSEVRAKVEISNRCNPGAVIVPKSSDDAGLFALVNSGSISWVQLKKVGSES